jgi:hypothetical protein
VFLLLLAVAEQINTTRFPSELPGDSGVGLDRAAQLAFLRSATPPPSGCRSFFVLDTVHRKPLSAGKRHAVTSADQLDAMLISQKYRIPTLNGFSSYFPSGWGLRYPNAPGYLGAVRSWAAEHRVQDGLCRLDLGTMRWQMEPAAAVRSR